MNRYEDQVVLITRSSRARRRNDASFHGGRRGRRHRRHQRRLGEPLAKQIQSADDARRRIERDLHDGAQQRLVALGLQVGTPMDQPTGLDGLTAVLSDVSCGLTAVLEELREISHAIHPAILSSGGLRAALKTLARRSTVPVTLDIAIAADYTRYGRGRRLLRHGRGAGQRGQVCPSLRSHGACGNRRREASTC